jgi:uncharacterized integral membrane protein
VADEEPKPEVLAPADAPKPAEDAVAKDDAVANQAKRTKLAKRREGARSFQPGLWLRLLPAGAAVVYFAFFIGLNTHHVKVSFVFSSTRVSLIWVVLLSGALGIVLGVLLSQLYRFRRRAAHAAKAVARASKP